MAVLAVLVSPVTDSVAAAQSSAPAALVQRVGDSTIGLLTEEGLTDGQREERMRDLLRDAFAVDAVGRFVLGRYWQTATAQQQQEYQVVFREYVVNSIASRFGEYSGEQMEVVAERDDHGKGTVVESIVDSPVHGRVQVLWRVRPVDGEQKIIDIIVEGVSLLLTQRSEFAAVIRTHGGNLDGLIGELRQKVALMKAQRPAR
jgi:phospholipid transport system substrate-binding protein